jgi:hypothetical protein
MKIQSTSKKQASLMKAATIEPKREIEEDILSQMGEEDTANLEWLHENTDGQQLPPLKKMAN